MIVLLCLILAVAAAGGGLLVAMVRRDEPLLGLYAMLAFVPAGIMSAVYATLDAA